MWVHQKQLYRRQPPPSYHSYSDASLSNSDVSRSHHLMDNLERPLQEGLDQGVPLPPVLERFHPSSPVLEEIVVRPLSPRSPLPPASGLQSPVEDRSGRTFRRSQRVKKLGQRCRPSKLTTVRATTLNWLSQYVETGRRVELTENHWLHDGTPGQE